MAQNGNHNNQAPSPVGNIASLHEKVALITGASSGLGRAIAQAYAAAGAYVVSADLTPTPPHAPIIAETLKGTDMTTPTVELVNKLWPSQREGVERASFVKCDVTSEESVKAAVGFAVERYERLDVMVNNAGEFILVLFSSLYWNPGYPFDRDAGCTWWLEGSSERAYSPKDAGSWG